MEKMFSIVIPVYNRASIVVQTLESIRKQTYRPIHLIVVDNNSTDNSFEILKDWQSENSCEDFIITVEMEQNTGAAAARNKGLSVVSTEYMAFFDSDDLMRPECVERYMAKFKENPSAEIVCSNSLYHTIGGQKRLFYFRKGDLMHNHIYHATLRTQGYAVRTNYMKKCGGWNNKVFVWNDWELGIRLLLNSPKVVSLDETLVDVYMQEKSITGLNFSSKIGQWEYALDTAYLELEKSTRDDKKTLLRLIDYRRVILATHYRKEKKYEAAQNLYKQVLSKRKDDFVMKILMPIVYHYTSVGGRGAAKLVDRFL